MMLPKKYTSLKQKVILIFNISEQTMKKLLEKINRDEIDDNSNM